VRRLEAELQLEKDKSVRDLVSGFERLASIKDKSSLAKETERLEVHYR
jgi:hypothetical protein